MAVFKVNIGTDEAPNWRNVGCVTDVLDDFDRGDASTLGTASSGLVYSKSSGGPAIIAHRAQSGDGTPNYLNLGGGVHHITIAFTEVTDATGAGADPNIVLLYVKDNGTAAQGYSARFYMANAGSNTMWVEVKRAGTVLGTYDTHLAWTVPRAFDCTLSFDPTTRTVGVRVEASGSSPWTTTIAEADHAWGANTLAGFQVLSTTALTDNLRGGSAPAGRLKMWDGRQWVVEANAADLAGLTGVTLHPLNVWDGGAWQLRACMKQSIEDLPDGLFDTGMYDLAVYG